MAKRNKTETRITVIVHCPKYFSTFLKNSIKKSAIKTIQYIPKTILKSKTHKIQNGTISIAIVSTSQIQKLNLKYRNKNKPTDVLSFSRMGTSLPFLPFDEVDLGDVLICWKIAKNQALQYQTTVKKELARLTVHGVLHLFGYDHEISSKEEKRMFKLQDKILQKI